MRPSVHHPRRARCAAAAAALVLLSLAFVPTAAAAAPAQVPPPATPPATLTTTAGPTSTIAAGTDEDCTARVHDATRIPAGPADPTVVAAANRLAGAGLEVHVRIQYELPNANQVAVLERTCGWSVEGVRSANAIVLFVTPGRGRAALWYGSDLRRTIGARFSALQGEVTNGGTTDQVLLLDGIGALVAADPPADPLGCDQLVWDPLDQLGDDTSVEDEAFAYQGLGADLRVRVEGTTDGDIDARQEALEASCPGWTVDGDRPPARVLLILQPQARSTGLWYGVDWSDQLGEGRFEDVQADVMNRRFQRGDFAGGLAAGLERLSSGRYAAGFDPYGSDRLRDYADYVERNRGSQGGPDGGDIVGPFLLIGVIAAAAWGFSYLRWKAAYESGETTESFGSYSRSRGGSGYRRVGSFGGGRRSSGGSRSSSGGGRRSSGGGSRRSGGGSTRW